MGSTGSIATLRNETITMSMREDQEGDSIELQTTPRSISKTKTPLLNRKDSAKDSESTLSGFSSTCNSPPIVMRRESKHIEGDDARTLIRNSHLDDSLDCESLQSLKSGDQSSQPDTRSISLTNVSSKM